jgi:hypothetical protein
MLKNFFKKRETFKKKLIFKRIYPKFFYLEEALFLSKFLSRIVGAVFDKNKNIINSWNFNNALSRWSLNKILSFSFFNYDFFINKSFLFLANILKKKKTINLNNNDIVLFGPWSDIYFHQLIDFILRINFIKKKKYKRIFLPFFLKKILSSSPYKEIFFNLNFFYYSYEKNIIFRNLRYLSGINHYSKNKILKNTILDLNNSIHQKFNLYSTKYKYTLISRKKSSRGLKNEDQLYEMLTKYNFKKYYFEDLSYLEQIRLCYNSKIVIGVHGSGLANLIFMKKNSNLIEMTNSFIENPIYKLLSNINKINYFKLRFHVNNSNLSGLVNVNLLEKVVQRILK